MVMVVLSQVVIRLVDVWKGRAEVGVILVVADGERVSCPEGRPDV